MIYNDLEAKRTELTNPQLPTCYIFNLGKWCEISFISRPQSSMKKRPWEKLKMSYRLELFLPSTLLKGKVHDNYCAKLMENSLD